jgi:serine/threonine-protein kinase
VNIAAAARYAINFKALRPALPTVSDMFDGRFRVLREMGRGGFGVVYEALDVPNDRHVALKVLLPNEEQEGAQLVSRLVREARALSLLESPHVARVIEAGQSSDGAPFLILELIQGKSLRAEIASRPVSTIEGLRWLAQVARALAAAHAAGIVHRDVKPANVLIDETGNAKLVDFGVCRLFGEATLTKTGMTLGTVHYMAPEQLHSSATVDTKADIWSFGVLLYAMFAGAFPFEGRSPAMVARNILGGVPKPLSLLAPTLPREVLALSQACLCRTSKDRPSAEDAAKTIEDVLGISVDPAANDEPTLVETARMPVPSLPDSVDAEAATLLDLNVEIKMPASQAQAELTERMPGAPPRPSLAPPASALSTPAPAPAPAPTPTPTPTPTPAPAPAPSGHQSRGILIVALLVVGLLTLTFSIKRWNELRTPDISGDTASTRAAPPLPTPPSSIIQPRAPESATPIDAGTTDAATDKRHRRAPRLRLNNKKPQGEDLPPHL